jgi:hypothetical protein
MRYALLSLMLILPACRDAQPPLPTSEQSDQLNEAEAMLNELDNEKGPEANAPGPSQI